MQWPPDSLATIIDHIAICHRVPLIRGAAACGVRATLRDWELYYPTEKLELSANSITTPSIFLSAPLYQRTWSIDHFSIFELSCPVTYPGRRSLCLPYSAFVEVSRVIRIVRIHSPVASAFTKIKSVSMKRQTQSPRVLSSALLPPVKIDRAYATDMIVAVQSRHEKHLKSARSCSNAIRFGKKDRKDLRKPLTGKSRHQTQRARGNAIVRLRRFSIFQLTNVLATNVIVSWITDVR